MKRTKIKVYQLKHLQIDKHGPRQPRLMVAVHKATVKGLGSQIGHAPWTQQTRPGTYNTDEQQIGYTNVRQHKLDLPGSEPVCQERKITNSRAILCRIEDFWVAWVEHVYSCAVVIGRESLIRHLRALSQVWSTASKHCNSSWRKLSLLFSLILHPLWKTQCLAPMAICAKKQFGLTAIFHNHFPSVLQEPIMQD